MKLNPDDSSNFKYCKSRIFCTHFVFVYFVRGGFRTKKNMHTKNSKQVREFAAVSSWTIIPCVRKAEGLKDTKI